MDATKIIRQIAFPFLGLGILAFVIPELLTGNPNSRVGGALTPSQTDEAYRDLWLSDAAGAAAHLTKALRADPASPERWADLADAFVEGDREALARLCIDRAVAAAPGLPHIRFRAANLSFRLGDTRRGLQESAAALRLSPDYAAIVFQAWHRLGGGPANVFRDAALGAGVARDYFVWLTSAADRAEVAQVWKLLGASARETETLAYIDYLIAQRDYPTASVLEATLPRLDGNLLHDGGFESLQVTAAGTSGAGWHVDPMEGVSAEPDTSMFRSGHTSLRVRFSGTNPEYRNVTQKVVLSQGVYRLTAVLKTQGITSEQGITIRLADMNDEHHFSTTQAITGSQPRRTVESTFRVGPGSSLVAISLSRRASWGFDTPLSGTVWADDLRLVRLREGS